MGIFNFFSSQFVDIIDWTQADSETMVYRFPRYNNEIKYGAKLTVREGQQAILVNEGKIADVFPPGIYELKTANLPILSSLQNWQHGFESPFKAEVYFFNNTNFLNQKWGTKQPITLADKKFGMVRLRAFGSYTLRIQSPKTLLKKLVGTDGNFEINEVNEQITNSIASRFPEVLAKHNTSILDLPVYYREISEALKQTVQAEATQYGLEIGDLFIENISLPESVQKILDDKTGMNIIGDGEELNQYTRYQTAKGMENSGTGSEAASAGIGMAIGMEVAKQMANNQTTTASNNQQTPVEPEIDGHPAVQPSPKIYYLMQMGERKGPMSINEIYTQLISGKITPETLIWKKGMSKWLSIADSGEVDLSELPPPLEK